MAVVDFADDGVGDGLADVETAAGQGPQVVVRWSSAPIAAATGLSENRVRAVLHGRQVVTSYDVLERIAVGLHIDGGLIGLAYTAA